MNVTCSSATVLVVVCVALDVVVVDVEVRDVVVAVLEVRVVVTVLSQARYHCVCVFTMAVCRCPKQVSKESIEITGSQLHVSRNSSFQLPVSCVTAPICCCQVVRFPWPLLAALCLRLELSLDFRADCKADLCRVSLTS